MPMKIYVLRLFAGRYGVDGSEVTTALNLDDAAAVSTLLNGHMEGALLRDGVERARWHEYTLRVHEFRSDGGAVGDPVMRWVLPAVVKP